MSNHLMPFEDMEKALAEFMSGLIPPVDVYEKDKNIVVETPLPGVDPKDVELSVEGNVLTIRGKSEHKKEVDEKDYYSKEVRYGVYQRRVALPAPVSADKAKAESEHGMLRVTLPRAKEEKKEKAKKIEVKKSKTSKK